MFRKNPDFQPAPNNDLRVSILVACFNEELFVESKIKNLLSLNYPPEKTDIIFVTDGSTDDTNDIIAKYQKLHPNRIKLYYEEGRKGKQHAINRIMPLIETDIIIFNDCNTIINPECVDYILPHFNNQQVGVVNGEKKIIVEEQDDAVSSGEGLYWRYESVLKQLDSDFYSSIGSAGELFAVRRSLYEEVPKHIAIEDFYLSMKIILKGYRNIYEPRAFAKELSSQTLSEEFKRKTRISAGAFQTMASLKEIYSLKHWKVLFLYISHRVIRWAFAPICLVLVFLSNFFLEGTFYEVAFKAQIVFYMLALLGYIFRRKKLKLTLIFIPFYFLFMHVALFKGFYDFITKKNHVVWEKAKRKMS